MLLTVKYGDFEFMSASGYPTPKISVDINNQRTPSSQYLGSIETINLNGVIYTHTMGKQYSTTFQQDSSSTSLLAKAIKLKELLLNQKTPEPRIFAVYAGNRSIVSGSGFITSINFDTSDNRATDKIDYSISIDIYRPQQTGISNSTTGKNKSRFLTSVGDSIEIETNSTELYATNHTSALSGAFFPTYTISRTISAVGYRGGTSGSLREAADWINDRQVNFPFTGIISTGYFPLYNHNRSLDIDESNGSITIRDSFLSKTEQKNQPWIDTYSISTSLSEDFTREIKINGNIKGLEPVTDLKKILGPIQLGPSGQSSIIPVSHISQSDINMKYRAALSGYSQITGLMYARALVYSDNSKKLIPPINFTNFDSFVDTPLHIIPLSITEGIDPVNGTIDYSYTFNTRPSAIIPGAISETFSITDTGPIPRISNMPIIGRRLGPAVYFYTNSHSMGEKTVTYEGVFKAQTGYKNFTINSSILNNIQNYILNFKPISPFTGFITSNTNNINLSENRIRQSITWQYTKCSNT